MDLKIDDGLMLGPTNNIRLRVEGRLVVGWHRIAHEHDDDELYSIGADYCYCHDDGVGVGVDCWRE